MSFLFFKNQKLAPRSRVNTWRSGGFTLLEMLVVIAIMSIVTGILLSNLPSFRDSTSSALVAQEIAINIRGAQVFGIGTRIEPKHGSTGSVFPGHGIYFCNPTPSTQSDACSKKFLLFSDEDVAFPTNGHQTYINKFFDNYDFLKSSDWATFCKGDAECREVYRLEGTIVICGLQVGDGLNVRAANGLHITFSRLYPDAFIKDDDDGGDSDTGSNIHHSFAKIIIKSRRYPQATPRVITVHSTGSITVTSEPNDVCPT